jgi:hypothetical protein
LGIPGYSRSSVGSDLEKLGAHRGQPIEERHEKKTLPEPTSERENKYPKFLQEKFNL